MVDFQPMDRDTLLALAGRLQIPIAVLIVAGLATEAFLRVTTGTGLGVPAGVLEFAAFIAGALGVHRPTELADKLARSVQEHVQPQGIDAEDSQIGLAVLRELVERSKASKPEDVG